MHAWLSPKGELHPVGPWGHEEWANANHNMSTDDLVRCGWRRLSEGYWVVKTCTQAQLDAIYQWHLDEGETFVPSDYEVV